MYSFVLRPKWILTHVVVVALLAAMISAGGWQLSRLDERKTENTLIEERAKLDVADIVDLVGPAEDYDVGDDLEFRKVTATGTFDGTAQVIVRNRPLEGGPGNWLLTPLLLDDGRAVVVNRGWVPNRWPGATDAPDTNTTSDRVTVTGFVRPTETARGLQVDDPADGVLKALARPNIQRYDQQTDYDLMPVFIQAQSISDWDSAYPVPLELPPLDNGPHLSYAMQWFIFATIGAVGYPLILRRVASGAAASIPGDEPAVA